MFRLQNKKLIQQIKETETPLELENPYTQKTKKKTKRKKKHQQRITIIIITFHCNAFSLPQ